MAKNLIIGAFSGYNYNQLKPWVESIDTCGFTGDKVMIVGNASQETIDELTKRNFKLVKMDPNAGKQVPIHVERFVYIWTYLKDYWDEYEYVVTTDVKDVIFQTNPIEWLEKNLGDKKIVAGSESIQYKNEPWGDENLMQTFGPFFYEEFKDCEIYNVGTLGGKSEYIKDLILSLFLDAIGKPIRIVDQSVYNVMIQTQPFKDITYFAQQKNGWACQAGTTADPSKIEQFRPHLLEAEPSFKDGVFLTSTGEPFSIVHQYDRVPEWKKFVMEKYNQEDPDSFFTHRTT
jgi:hypothetical protein